GRRRPRPRRPPPQRASPRWSRSSPGARRPRAMDNTRLFLWLALAAMLWLNHDAWMRDRAPQRPAAETTAEIRPTPTDDELLPELRSDAADAEIGRASCRGRVGRSGGVGGGRRRRWRPRRL